MPADHDRGSDQQQAPGDARLYVLQPDQWEARVKQTWEKEYCYSRHPGEDHFHLLMCGEIYLQQEDEKICLNCALRREIITRDRLAWQRKSK